MAKRLKNFQKMTTKDVFLSVYKACSEIPGKRGPEAGYLLWGHLTRCASLTQDFFASEYGGSNRKSSVLKELFLSGLLHDIGKLFLPAELLLKKKLEKEDWPIIEKHVEKYYVENALEKKLGIDYKSVPHEIIDIGTKHHVLLDGTGYSGVQIDSMARFSENKVLLTFMIIDKFEAGTSFLRPWQPRKRYMQIFLELQEAMEKGQLDKTKILSFFSFLFDDSITNLTCLPQIVSGFYGRR